MGPAMRIDLASGRRGRARRQCSIDYFAAEPVPLLRLRGTGAARARGPFQPQPLIASDFAVPEIEKAETFRLTFQATAVASDLVLPDGQVLRFADPCACPAPRSGRSTARPGPRPATSSSRPPCSN